MILIIYAGRSFRGTIDFSRMLHNAAFNDAKREWKEAPLFTESGSRGAPTLRIRAMQHMTIIHLQRKLAILAEDIVSSKTATETQMDRVQDALKDYGMGVIPCIYLFSSIHLPVFVDMQSQ